MTDTSILLVRDHDVAPFTRDLVRAVQRVLGPVTADYLAIIAERERRDAIATGRHHEGNRSTWYARITWSHDAWWALHGDRGLIPR